MVTTTYTIQMASKISGVGVHTIRAWEKRYKALVPNRDASGHRTYSKSDVEKLMLLSELCLLGYTISKVAGMSIPDLKELLLDLGKTQESLESQDFNLVTEARPALLPEASLSILTFALQAPNIGIISLELGKLKSQLSPRDFALSIIFPLSNTLKDLYAKGGMSASQYEAIYAIFIFHMGHSLYHTNEKQDKSSLNVVIGGIREEADQIFLGIAGLICAHYGFHCTYLGVLGADAFIEGAAGLEAKIVIVESLGKMQSANFLERLHHKINEAAEIVVLTKNTIPALKHLVTLQSFEALDEYLAKKF